MLYVAMLLLPPVAALVNGKRFDRDWLIAIGLLDLLLIGLIAMAVRRYRNLASSSRVQQPDFVRAQAETGSRVMPLMALVLGLAGVAYAASSIRNARVSWGFLLITPLALLLGLAGTIHPPVFYAIRRPSGEEPLGTRLVAYFLAATGLAIGGLSAWYLLDR